MTAFPRVARVDTIVVSLPRETPYLGPLGGGDRAVGDYVVRAGNRTLYPTVDHVGARQNHLGRRHRRLGRDVRHRRAEAVVAIIDDVLGPQVTGRDPRDVVVIQEDLYDLMRVRGFFGGFYVDAIAGVDIALWDLFGKLVRPARREAAGRPAHRDRFPPTCRAFPAATLADKVALAREFAARGFDAFKYAAAVSFDGIEEEMRALREALGTGREADGRPALEILRRRKRSR